MKELIVFFSRAGENHVDGMTKYIETGNTKVAARMLREITGADMTEIIPEKPYSENYKECVAEAVRDWKKDARPKIMTDITDISGYGAVYLGYPNYCGTMPMFVCTFLEGHDFSGKIIRPFCTNEGSGLGSSVEKIRELCPGAEVEEGLSLKGTDVAKAGETIKEWVRQHEPCRRDR